MSISFSVMVLAGGRSSRMGRDKAFLPLGGRPLVEHVLDRVAPLSDDVLLVVREAEPFRHLPVRLVEDRPGPRGALTGLVSGLREVRHEWALAVACDMPFLNPRLIRHMALLAPGHDVVIPQAGGLLEPLHAFYRRTCLGPMEDLLRQGEQKVIAFFPRVRVRVVDEKDLESLDPGHLSFWNINTPEDWERAQQLYAEQKRERGLSSLGGVVRA
ncbi:MAG: molybdenum cofactor guanylyltransferase [Anaerolineae bacterium]